MANNILLKKSSIAAKVPTTSDLDYGELALNYADGALYYKTSGNSIARLNPPESIGFANVAVSGQSTVTADTATGTLTLAAGNGAITLTTNSATDTVTISHTDTSSVSNLSSDNSAGVVLQDIAFTFDTYGHVQTATVATTNLDSRYLQSESDTLATVTTRGATTTNAITVGGLTVNGDASITGDVSGIDSLTFDTTATEANAVGKLYWNANDGTLSFGLVGGNSINHIGQHLTNYVYNDDTTTINKGEVVYLFGAHGDRASVKKASNASEATSSKTVGVASENIAPGAVGFVVSHGVVDGLSLGAYNPGDLVYLGTTPGTITTTLPVAPYHTVFVGVIARANNGNGQLFVKIQNGLQIDELHDIQIIGLANNDSLFYDSATYVWKNTTPTNARTKLGLGTIATQNANTVAITGGAIDGTPIGATTASTGKFTTLQTTGNVTVGGNLTVTGTTTTVNTQNLTVSDNMIYLNNGIQTTISTVSGSGTVITYTTVEAHNYSAGMSVTVTGVSPTQYNISNQTITGVGTYTFTVAGSATGSYVSGGTARAKSGANPDLGWAAGYNDGTYHHAGFFRDATDGYFKVFKDYTPEPDADIYINTSDASFALADIQAANFRGALVGNADSATILAYNRTINGVTFNGSANITITANTTNALTIGSGLSGTSFNGSSAVTITVDNTVARVNDVHYIGTTSIALNRASAAQSLTGINGITSDTATDLTLGAGSGIVTTAGILKTTNTTASSSTTTGSLVAAGGLGVAGAANIGGATSIGTTLGVTGDSTFAGTINANKDGGNISLKANGTTAQSGLFAQPNTGYVFLADYSTATKGIKVDVNNSGLVVLGSGGITAGGVLTINGTGTNNFSGAIKINSGAAQQKLQLDRASVTDSAYVQWQTAGSQNWVIGTGATGNDTNLTFYSYGGGASALTLNNSTGAATVGGNFAVNGTGTSSIAGNLNITGLLAAHQTAALNLAYEGSSLSQLVAYGADGSNYGRFNLILRKGGTGVDAVTALAVTSTAVTLAGNIVVNGGTGTISGSSAYLKLTSTAAAKTWDVFADNSGPFYISHSGVLNALQIAPTTGATTIAGNVTVNGTGTNTFAGPIQVNRGTTGTAAFLQAGSVGAGQQVNLFLGKTDSANNEATIIYHHVADASTSNYLGLGFYGADDLLNLKANGNALFGTTSDNSNGRIQLASHSTSAGGIGFGADTSFYRIGSAQLMADGGAGGAIIGIAVSGVRKGYIYHNATEFFADADAGAFNIRTLSASNIVLKTNNTLALTVDGTTQKATFAGAVRVTGALYDSSNSAGTSGQVLTSTGTGTAWSSSGAAVTGSGTAGYIPKWSTTTGLTNSLVYDSGTNVGVGTASPGGKFEINHTAATGATALIIRCSDSTANGAIRWQNSGGTNQAGIGTNFNISDSGAIEFLNGTTTNMVLRSSGNLGIGIASPTVKLHVAGDAKIGTNSQRISLFDDGNAHIHSTDSILWINSEANTDVRINNQYNGNVILTNGTGSVGIGTNSPTQKLDVAGNIAWGTDHVMAYSTITTTTTTANQVVTAVSSTAYRTAKFVIQAVDATAGKYQSQEIMAIHNGSTVAHTEYTAINVGGAVATYDVDISAGTIRLLCTPLSTNSTVFKVAMYLIKA